MPKTTKKKRVAAAFPPTQKFQLDPALEQAQAAVATAEAKPVTVTTSQDYLLYFIFVFSLFSMLGSLYFSTYGDPVKNLQLGQLFPLDSGLAPCELCWYARILMYPITMLSVVGLIKDDKHVTDYILPLSVIGIGLEIFHYGLQKWNFPNPFRCTTTTPCSALQVQYLGFITIPLLAMVGFSFITLLCLINWQLNRKKKWKLVGGYWPLITAKISSRFSSIMACVLASKFSRTSGSVFEVRTLKVQSP